MPPRPTDVELSLLRALWELGPATVKQVHAHLNREREMSYTGVLRMLQVMFEKGLVQRDERERAHVYWPTEAKQRTQKAMLGELMDQVFGGSARDLVQMALGARSLSPEERAKLKSLLEEGP